jgi:hypothetical protein
MTGKAKFFIEWEDLKYYASLEAHQAELDDRGHLNHLLNFYIFPVFQVIWV